MVEKAPIEPPAAPTPDAAAIHDVKPDPPLVGYEDGFFLRTPDGASKLRIRGLVQPRFTLVEPSLTAAPGDVSASFAVQRAQIELVGHVFTKDISFALKTEFGRGAAFVKDAYLDLKILDGVVVRAGLYKRPFQRQQLASDWRLAFFDRNLTEETFKGGRDIGLSLHDALEQGPSIEWSAGVFSGTSEKPKVSGDVVIDPDGGVGVLDNVQISNVPKLFSPTFAGRVGFNSSPALKPYSEVDVDGGGFRFGTSLGVLDTFDIVKNTSLARFCVDGIVKFEHFTATGAVVLSVPGAFNEGPDGVGAFLQAGVLLQDRVSPGMRYSIVNQVAEGVIEQEIAGNLTVLLFGQNVLWGIEGGTNVVDGVPDVRFRSQAQIAF